MEFKKWLMKQQWRLVKIRGIWGLPYGILLLAIAYFGYIPFFRDLGFLGVAGFAMSLFIGFVIMGYLYDKIFVMWAPAVVVTQERNPYQYIPRPIDRIFWLPIYSAILDSTESLAKHFNIDTREIEETREYYTKLQGMDAIHKEDIDIAIALREEYVREHPFSDILKDDTE